MSILDFNAPNEEEVFGLVGETKSPRLEAASDVMDYINAKRSTIGARGWMQNAMRNRGEEYLSAVGDNRSKLELMMAYGLLGNRLYDDVAKEFPEAKQLYEAGATGLVKDETGKVVNTEEAMQKYVDLFIEKKRIEDPVKFGSIKTYKELKDEIDEQADKIEKRMMESSSKAPKDIWQTMLNFGGGMIAAGVDYENVATLGVGGAAKTLLGKMAYNAAENVAVEALMYPELRNWNEEVLNEQYGLNELVTNMGYSAAFGAAVPVAGKIIGPPVRAGVDAASSVLQKAIPDSIKLANMERRLRRAGEVELADRLSAMRKGVEVKESDLGGSILSREDGNLALKETRDAILEDRPINSSKIPLDEKVLKPENINKIKDGFLRNQLKKFVDVYTKAEIEPIATGAAAKADGLDSVSYSRASEGVTTSDAMKNNLLKEQEIRTNIAALDEIWSNNKDFKYNDKGKDLDINGFKDRVKQIDALQRAVSVCGGG